jgi:NitT/TauT family transport system permease protein
MKMTGTLTKRSGFFLFLLLLWQLASLFAGNSFLFPSPWTVLQEMIVQAQTPGFFSAVDATFLRVGTAVLASFFSGVFLACLAGMKASFRSVLADAMTIFTSLPNVSIIILLLFWTTRENAIFIMLFLLLLPGIYRTVLASILETQERFQDVLDLYPADAFTLITKIYLPASRKAMEAALITACSMGFKGGVMAEVLCSAALGIGRQLQYARFEVNPAGVMGWTIWMLLGVWLIERLIQIVFRRLSCSSAS